MHRTWMLLAHDWRFLRDEAPDAWQPTFDDSNWQTVTVPHSFNAQDTFIPTRFHYRGPAWYRCRLPRLPPGARVELDALGSFALTHVWLNGAFLGRFMGGFTGFSVDLTPHLRRRGRNVLALRVSNQHNPDILPGKHVPDYNVYGGIYREIGLVVTDPLHIARRGLVVNTPEVSDASAMVTLDVRLRNDRPSAAGGRVEVTVAGPDGAIVSRGSREFSLPAGSEATLDVPLPAMANPALWSPGTPNLYRLTATVRDGSRVVDEASIPFGFRWYKFDVDKGFLLNGRPLKLRGVNRHQDYPGLGNALPANLQALDVELIKELGGNFVRCSHYPMHPAFLEACDRLGVLVYEEIASWQYIGGEAFARNAQQMMEEMIARDRHHPSIILWGLLNEGRDAALFNRLNDTAHRCDPYRPTTYAENNPEKGLELGTVHIPDVLGINYLMDELDAIRAKVPGKPMFSSEHTNAGPPRGDIEKEVWQMYRVVHDIDRFERREWMAGSALWSMHDYGTDLDVVWPLQRSGAFDAWRLPKASALAMRALWNPEPFIRIIGHWNHTGLELGDAHWAPRIAYSIPHFVATGPLLPGVKELFDAYVRRCKPVPVVVVSNAAEVELFLNGRSLGRQTAAQGCIWYVDYEPGALRAVGRWPDGRELADERLTSLDPDDTGAVRLEALHKELPANGVDVTLVTATIVDKNGVFAPLAQRAVGFRTYLGGREGGAEILGVGGVPGLVTQAGIGRIAIRAGREPGTLRIVAAGTALRSGETTIALVPA